MPVRKLDHRPRLRLRDTVPTPLQPARPSDDRAVARMVRDLDDVTLRWLGLEPDFERGLEDLVVAGRSPTLELVATNARVVAAE